MFEVLMSSQVRPQLHPGRGVLVAALHGVLVAAAVRVAKVAPEPETGPRMDTTIFIVEQPSTPERAGPPSRSHPPGTHRGTCRSGGWRSCLGGTNPRGRRGRRSGHRFTSTGATVSAGPAPGGHRGTGAGGIRDRYDRATGARCDNAPSSPSRSESGPTERPRGHRCRSRRGPDPSGNQGQGSRRREQDHEAIRAPEAGESEDIRSGIEVG